MEVFNNNYYQAPIQQQQPYYNVNLLRINKQHIFLFGNKKKKIYFEISKMPYYQPTEVYYPDYNTFAQPSDFNAPYQIYNYEKPIENTDFYMCKPN